MRETLQRLGRFARRALLVAGGVSACLAGALWFFGGRASDQKADCIVVFGAAIRKGRTPSDALEYRLDHALTLYRLGRARRIVVTGGGEGNYDEAAVMRQWLCERGVPATAILVDSDSSTTRESGKNVSKLMQSHRLKSALVVSQWFHVARCRLVLEQEGTAETLAAPCGGNTLRREPFFVARELLGLPAYFFRLDELRS